MNKIIVIAAAAGLALPSVPARAEWNSVTVDYSDLNLASERGQERLARRIEAAARKVCGYYGSGTVPIIGLSKARACYKKAKADALPQFTAVVERHARGG